MEQAGICPICHAAAHHVLTTKDYHYGNSGQYGLFGCNQCGHHFQHPMPSDAEMESYYPQEYYAYQPPEADLRPRGLQHRGVWLTTHYLRCCRGYRHLNLTPNPLLALLGWRLIHKRRDLVAPRYIAGGKACDFGCGSGNAVAAMRYYGWHAEGIEFSAAAVAAGRTAGLAITHGSIEVLESRPETYDLITCSHCVEHVPDYRRLFMAFFRALKPGGTLVVEAPHGEAKAMRIYGECFYYLTLPVHAHLFSARSLRQVAMESGFAEIAIKMVNYWHSHAASWLLRRDIRQGVKSPRINSHGKWSIRLAMALSLPGFIRCMGSKGGDCMILTCRRPEKSGKK